MRAEKALPELKSRQVKDAVHPGNVVERCLYALACLGVIEHYFAASWLHFCIQLPEHGSAGPVAGIAYIVTLYELLYGRCVKQAAQECHKPVFTIQIILKALQEDR